MSRKFRYRWRNLMVFNSIKERDLHHTKKDLDLLLGKTF